MINYFEDAYNDSITTEIDELIIEINELDNAPVGPNLHKYKTDTIDIYSECKLTALYENAYSLFDEAIASIEELLADFIQHDKETQLRNFDEYASEISSDFMYFIGEPGVTKISIGDFLVMYNDKSLADMIIKYYEKFLIDIKRVENKVTDTEALRMIQVGCGKIIVIVEKAIKSLTVDMDAAYDKYTEIFNNITAEAITTSDRHIKIRKLRKQREKLERALI